jgi:hypothetical protein
MNALSSSVGQLFAPLRNAATGLLKVSRDPRDPRDPREDDPEAQKKRTRLVVGILMAVLLVLLSISIFLYYKQTHHTGSQ